jgi:hypothetical protein
MVRQQYSGGHIAVSMLWVAVLASVEESVLEVLAIDDNSRELQQL